MEGMFPCARGIVPGVENIGKYLMLKQLIIRILFFILPAIAAFSPVFAQQKIITDVLVIGGGTGGIAAGLQCARMNVKTFIAEESTWLVGMLSAAGVSATDGNHNLPGGIWNEFRNELYKVYGGADKVATGWISNTHFEPHVADSIFKLFAAREENLTVRYQLQFKSVLKKNNQITGATFIDLRSGKKITIKAKQVIEATELGDVMSAAKVPFDIGMESGQSTGEDVGITETNNIIQDLTWVAILKDYGKGADQTIPKPANYTASEFDGACTDYYINKNLEAPNVDAQKMLEYAKLPNGKYMINWPKKGNDTYLNVIALSPVQRKIELVKAKQQTLRFVYFIQTQLGFKNLGLATDEFPTADHLAIMPYYREGRRLKGMARLTINQVAKPFDYHDYRSGIAVGDYPIDHHHKKNPGAPQHLEFFPIPSYNIPLGCLIPGKINGLIVCDKSISVSNVVNGTTRLQPVVLLTGQAAGVLAALCVKENKQARQIPVRAVQSELLKANALIMPYIDAGIHHPHFIAIQKIGATGILRGRGIPYKWANQTWFYPDSSVNKTELQKGLTDAGFTVSLKDGSLTIAESIALVKRLSDNKQTGIDEVKWKDWNLENFDKERNITRAELAVLLNETLDPFNQQQPDFVN